VSLYEYLIKINVLFHKGNMNVPQLNALNNYTLKIGKKWYDLGVQLLDSSVVDKLDTIREDYRDVETCCREMFKFWIDNDEAASWKKLVEKLRIIGYNVLA